MSSYSGFILCAGLTPPGMNQSILYKQQRRNGETAAAAVAWSITVTKHIQES